jgi:hypothetical protein
MANEVHPVFQDLVNGLAVIAHGGKPADECGDPCEAGAITCPLIGCDSCGRNVPACHLSPILYGGSGCHACSDKAALHYGYHNMNHCEVCNGS